MLDHQAGVAATSDGVGSAAATRTAVAARRGTDGRCAGGRRSSRARCVWFATRPAPPARRAHDDHHVRVGCVNAAGADRDVAITPDGSRVVYRGNNQLLVRALNQLEPTVLSGLGAPRGVFISPDGQWVGFFDGSHDQESGDHRRAASDDRRADRRQTRAVPHGGRTGPSSSRRTHRRQACSACPPQEASPPCSRSPIASAAKAITCGPSSCLEARRSSSRLLRPAAASRTRRSRCWICRPARRRCSSVAAATRTTCRRGIWSTASQGRCAPWHSTSDGWRWSGRLRRCSRAW